MGNVFNLSTPHFVVKYQDDEHRTHITVARNVKELSFLQNRFYVIEYNFIER